MLMFDIVIKTTSDYQIIKSNLNNIINSDIQIYKMK